MFQMIRGFAQNIDGLPHRLIVLFNPPVYCTSTIPPLAYAIEVLYYMMQYLRWVTPSGYCIFSISDWCRSAKKFGYCETKNYNAPLSDAIKLVWTFFILKRLFRVFLRYTKSKH